MIKQLQSGIKVALFTVAMLSSINISASERYPLIYAAARGQLSEVIHLVEGGADINQQNSSGRTAIMAATRKNHPEIVRVLLKMGADQNIQDNRKDTPFLYAGAEGLTEVLKATIEYQPDTRLLNRYGGTALIPAAEHAHLDVMRLLLEETDVDIDHVNNLGWTALMEAILLGDGGKKQQQAVALLIKHGANVNIPDSRGVTPLSHALHKGYTEIAQMLRAAGAHE